MTELAYVLEGRPTSWKRTNHVSGRHITDKAMKAAQAAHRWAALAARPRGWDDAVPMELEVLAYMPHGGSLPDTDNVLKLVADALQRVVYRNDRQLVRVVGERRLDRERPRTEVTIRRRAE